MPLNYYQVLNLPSSSTLSPSYSSIRASDIKVAYRSALLFHHPDKTTPATTIEPRPEQLLRHRPLNSSTTSLPKKYTIDDITLAYKVLSNSSTRSDHDRELRLSASQPSPLSLGEDTQKVSKEQYTGIEAVDLDDLGYDEGEGMWYRSCRCGDERGFRFTEGDLEAEAERGDVVIGCQGCSLWIRVEFGVEERG